ncbi:MAG: AAA family ATPase [Prevotella sp.]|nr:AAA family ATPase [Prevotella sp.]
MIADELKYRILEALGMEPTAEQDIAINVFCRFLMERDEQSVMILRGSAGTGKTTLAAAFVRMLLTMKQKIVLLAPTGRAAKVLSLYAGHPAYTIHRRIYRQRTAGDMSAFNVNANLQSDTLFIIDEASMIANDGYGDSAFGSGRLLDDLIQYVYNGRNCRMMLIGDRAQLPPVGEEDSPALQSDFMRGYGLQVFDCDLNEVLRQSSESGILYNATMIRTACFSDCGEQLLPKIRLKCFADIRVVPGDELIETMASSYSEVGLDETMVITRSNKRANIYNQGIRNMILGREEALSSGDMLMVVRNNYHWTSGESNESDRSRGFIANGDRMRIRRIRNIRNLYGFRFADITVEFPDYDDSELTATAMLDSLTSEAPSLTREQMELLYNNVMEDYADIPLKADRLKRLKQDPYYNALQIKFAYAITCHKAQGGQWAHIYLDQGYMTEEMLSADYIHWLYTAFTRASEKLFLVNWPKTQMTENEDSEHNQA